MQEVHINVNPTTRHQRKRKDTQRGFMDKAVIYCLFMCTVLDAAILALYWHSVTARTVWLLLQWPPLGWSSLERWQPLRSTKSQPRPTTASRTMKTKENNHG